MINDMTKYNNKHSYR